jgi:tripartite-type tricarboxylate transporter receptor subunit TctC
MAVERLNKLAGVKINYVPFKGTGDLITALIGMHVDGAMGYLPLAIQQKGKVRTLAIATEKRNPALPDVPTLAEAGLSGLEIADWIGIVAPAGTPAAVLQQLNQAFVQVLKTPQIRESLSKAGAQVVASSPQELTEHTHQEFDRWQALVKAASIKIE